MKDPRLTPGTLMLLHDSEGDNVFVVPATDFPDLSHQSLPNGTIVMSLGKHQNILQDSYATMNENYQMVKIMSHAGIGAVFLSECKLIDG